MQEVNLSGARRPEEAPRLGQGQGVSLLSPSSAPREEPADTARRGALADGSGSPGAWPRSGADAGCTLFLVCLCRDGGQATPELRSLAWSWRRGGGGERAQGTGWGSWSRFAPHLPRGSQSRARTACCCDPAPSTPQEFHPWTWGSASVRACSGHGIEANLWPRYPACPAAGDTNHRVLDTDWALIP